MTKKKIIKKNELQKKKVYGVVFSTRSDTGRFSGEALDKDRYFNTFEEALAHAKGFHVNTYQRMQIFEMTLLAESHTDEIPAQQIITWNTIKEE